MRAACGPAHVQRKQHAATVWLVNTGWSGGAYGVGSRMKLSHTRRMVNAALGGELDEVSFDTVLSNSFGFGGTNATLALSKLID